MPWRCPACRSEIRPTVGELHPDPESVYRCHVCRLDLQFDPMTQVMSVTPLDIDHGTRPSHRRPHVPPAPLQPKHK